MPPKRDLKAFLRKEIKKGRIEAPSLPPPVPKQALEEPPLILLRIRSFKKLGLSSLFGDTITTNLDSNDNDSHSGRIKSQTNAADRKDATPGGQQQPSLSTTAMTRLSYSRTPSKNPELDLLRRELEDVITKESVASWHDKGSIRKEKAALIDKIGGLERAERQEKVRKIKQPFNEPLSKLPDPIAPGEKESLMKKAERIESARTNPYTPSPKRRRADLDDDLLDGEDRMRLGLKRSKGGQASGHWRTTLNDYMPESQVNTEMFNKIKSLTTEEKKADRELLNEYLRNAAIVDRYDKRMERKLEEMKRAKRKQGL